MNENLTTEQKVLIGVAAAAGVFTAVIGTKTLINKIAQKRKLRRELETVWADLSKKYYYTSATPEHQKLLRDAFFTGKYTAK